MNTEPAASRWTVWGQRALLTITALFLGVVIAAPIALSSQDIVAWAGAPSGLGLLPPWDVFTFVALDLAAFVCVCMVVYAAWRGESGGLFGVLVWLFAAGSAYANFRHGTRPDAPADARWFFPAMSLAGPALLEVTVRRIRRWVQTSAGRYEHPLPHFRLVRWLPGIAMRETWRAWKLAVTEGYSRPEDAITAARMVRTSKYTRITPGPDPAVEVTDDSTGPAPTHRSVPTGGPRPGLVPRPVRVARGVGRDVPGAGVHVGDVAGSAQRHPTVEGRDGGSTIAGVGADEAASDRGDTSGVTAGVIEVTSFGDQRRTIRWALTRLRNEMGHDAFAAMSPMEATRLVSEKLGRDVTEGSVRNKLSQLRGERNGANT